MKGKKRFIVTMLFFINIIMLVAAVIPHHHHPNGMICMKQDQPVEHLLRPQERRVKNYYIYRESLHGTKIPRTSSLRAPPYSVFA